MQPIASAAPAAARRWIVVESALATLVTLWLAVHFDRPSAWVALPLMMLLLERRHPKDYGLELRITPPTAARHVALAVALLAGYGLIHFWFATLTAGATFQPRLPPHPGWLLLHQLLLVAFPEELFFRGYLQSNLERVTSRRFLVIGARTSPALVLQAAIFAVCHLVSGDWTRLRVFFFGLLAGWLRARSGSILAPVLYHAIANFWYAVLVASLA